MKEKINAVKKVDKYLIAGSFLIILILGCSFAFSLGFFKSAADKPLFSFKSGSVILIDKSLNFKSPLKLEAKDNLVIRLGKGTYYWKIKDAIPEGDVVQLDILESVTSLKLKKLDLGYEVVNSGNSSLNVDVYASGRFTGNVILGTNDGGNVSEVVEIGVPNV